MAESVRLRRCRCGCASSILSSMVKSNQSQRETAAERRWQPRTRCLSTRYSAEIWRYIDEITIEMHEKSAVASGNRRRIVVFNFISPSDRWKCHETVYAVCLYRFSIVYFADESNGAGAPSFMAFLSYACRLRRGPVCIPFGDI